MGKPRRRFNAQLFLESAGAFRNTVVFQTGDIIYSQGERSDAVMYLADGRVTISVLATNGNEAIVAWLRPGDFFGEGCLAGQARRAGSATAIVPSRVAVIDKRQMLRLLRDDHAVSDRFIAHMLSRNIRIEEDLLDLLFHTSEKRLARALLLLARQGDQENGPHIVPGISQGVLSKMVGTTRSRVNFFMKKFKRLGLIEYNGSLDAGLQINSSLLTAVLLEDRPD